jgi:hypothetical protein
MVAPTPAASVVPPIGPEKPVAPPINPLIQNILNQPRDDSRSREWESGYDEAIRRIRAVLTAPLPPPVPPAPPPPLPNIDDIVKKMRADLDATRPHIVAKLPPVARPVEISQAERAAIQHILDTPREDRGASWDDGYDEAVRRFRLALAGAVPMRVSAPSCTLIAMVKGQLNRVTLVKTSSGSMNVDTKVWNQGTNPDLPPDSENVVALTNCTASADGATISALGPPTFWGSHPIVQVILTGGAADTAEIKVTGAWLGNMDETPQISKNDYDAAVAFVLECGFPLSS